MMSTCTTTSAIVGLSAGKRPSPFSLDVSAGKLSFGTDFRFVCHHHVTWTNNSSSSSSYNNSNRNRFLFNCEKIHAIRALKEDVNTDYSDHSSLDSDEEEEEEEEIEALYLLRKILLEKQWNLSIIEKPKVCKETKITSSGVSARRRRRIDSQRKSPPPIRRPTSSTHQLISANKKSSSIIKNRLLKRDGGGGYVKGFTCRVLLTHSEVLLLSEQIQTGLYLEKRKSRLKEKLGWEPTEEQIATSLRITRAELQIKQIECCLAREKLAMSNVRLVSSIAQKFENMGAELDDLVQAGLIGLLRGIEKFDSSKGFKLSTYLYWWIRQGISRALAEHSGTVRLPYHLHGRLIAIRNAKAKLKSRGITPSIDRIAECLNMSSKKVRNATEAVSKVFSLDGQAFPSFNSLPGATLHSYIADTRLENNPWHGVDEAALKGEVNKLISTSLGPREEYIIRLYYGLDNQSLTWEDISRRIGLSGERVRQVGLVAVEKLKHAARTKRLDVMLGEMDKLGGGFVLPDNVTGLHVTVLSLLLDALQK